MRRTGRRAQGKRGGASAGAGWPRALTLLSTGKGGCAGQPEQLCAAPVLMSSA